MIAHYLRTHFLREQATTSETDSGCGGAGSGSGDPAAETRRQVLLAFYRDVDRAREALDRLLSQDFPMDRISVLGRSSASGDDPLGIYYAGVGERMRGWGSLGALWGGVWGVLTGAAGLFLLPGIGAVAAAGPVVEALAGAAAGAGVGGAAMAGAGAAAQLSVAIHRMGIPDICLDEIRERLGRGEHLVLMIVHDRELDRWHAALQATEPLVLWRMPYTGLVEGVRRAL
jgi:hypothetical protein